MYVVTFSLYVGSDMDLGFIGAQLLLLLGKCSDAEPNYGLPAPQVGDHLRSMLRVPVEQHTGATPVCMICWIYLAAPRLDLSSESRFDLRSATSTAGQRQ